MQDTIVLVSIDPKWATAIYNGDKKYEYRRTPPARDPPYIVVFYESAPTSALTGSARIDDDRSGAPPDVVDETVDKTPHTRTNVLEYFDGCDTGTALHVAETTQYDTPVPLTQLRDEYGISPPQNFQYLSEHEYVAIQATATQG